MRDIIHQLLQLKKTEYGVRFTNSAQLGRFRFSIYQIEEAQRIHPKFAEWRFTKTDKTIHLITTE